jgi:hypothetical protein
VVLLGVAVAGSLPWTGEILGRFSRLLSDPDTIHLIRRSLGLVAVLALLGGLCVWRGRSMGASLALAGIMVPGAWILSHVGHRMSPLESRAALALWVAQETPAQWPLVIADPRDRQFEGIGGWGFYAQRKVLMVSFEPAARHVGQAAGRPDWVISPDDLADEVISGSPMVLGATQDGVQRLALGNLPPPAARDERFSIWVLRPSSIPEGDPPPGPDSTRERAAP